MTYLEKMVRKYGEITHTDLYGNRWLLIWDDKTETIKKIELPKPMKDETLENFMKEFFPYKELRKIGFFTKEMRGDYKAQAERVCKFFGYKTVYEYGAKEVRCHLSTGDSSEPFVTVIKSIYE